MGWGGLEKVGECWGRLWNVGEGVVVERSGVKSR